MGEMADYYSNDTYELFAEQLKSEARRELAGRGHVPKNKAFFILWNPKSDLPPTRVFVTRKEAEDCARMMATKFKGQAFYICEASGFAAAAEPPVELTALKRGKK